MGKVIAGMTLSLDGFVNDRNGDFHQLYPDLVALAEAEMLAESMRMTGAALMGRHSYELFNGDLTDYEYQVPLFVVSHSVSTEPLKGLNERMTLTFVTDGIESAISQAKAAACDKDVTVVGGANTTQQLLNAGLVDELHVGFMPVLFYEGLRLFENLNPDIKLEKIKTIDGPDGRTDIFFRVVR